MANLKDNADPAKASFWYTICSIVQKGIGMLLVPLYVRLMTTQEYGTYTLFQSWESIIMVFTTLNLAAYAFSNSLIKNEDKKDYVTGAFLGLICTLTTIACVVFFLFLDFWESIFGFSGIYIILMALDSMFYVAIDLWYAKKRFDYQYKGVVFVTLFISVSNLILGSFVVSQSTEKALAAVFIKTIIQGVTTFILGIDIWKKGKVFFDKALWQYALCFNIPLIPHFLSTRILQQSDRVMIQKFCNIADAGIYGFSYKISEVMLVFNAAILASLIPWTYKKLKNKKFKEICHKSFLTIVLIAVLNFGLILLAPEAVAILGTKEYQQAMYIIPPIAVSCFLMYLFNVFVNITYYYENNKLVVIASLVAAGINIVLNWIFIPTFGYLAAGYTTLASYICLAIMHALMYKYTLKQKKIDYPIYNLKKIAIFAIIFIIVSVAVSFFYEEFLIRYILVAIIGIIIIVKHKQILKLIKSK